MPTWIAWVCNTSCSAQDCLCGVYNTKIWGRERVTQFVFRGGCRCRDMTSEPDALPRWSGQLTTIHEEGCHEMKKKGMDIPVLCYHFTQNQESREKINLAKVVSCKRVGCHTFFQLARTPKFARVAQAKRWQKKKPCALTSTQTLFCSIRPWSCSSDLCALG